MASESTKNPELIYDFTVKDAKGNDVHLSTYKGKVLLIVNVASKCGMTNSNYTELNQLYQKYKERGLEILGFPCNQFGEEEPGSTDQILDFVCIRFKSEFPIFDKIEVNGEKAAPLYNFLKLGKWGFFGDDIQWNFAKFLLIRMGVLLIATTLQLLLLALSMTSRSCWRSYKCCSEGCSRLKSDAQSD